MHVSAASRLMARGWIPATASYPTTMCVLPSSRAWGGARHQV